ncbi:MAG: hypothetical protein RL033_604 [Pseudomonadota bacterium]
MRFLASCALFPMLALTNACSEQEAAEPDLSSSELPSSAGDAPSSGMGELAAASTGPNGEPSCRNRPDTVCVPDGFPFAVVALGVSDLCGGPQEACPRGRNPPPGATTMKMTQAEPGKLCLAGTVAEGGYSQFLLAFSVPNAAMNQLVKTFDAQSLGITQLAFTLDSPPSGGITVGGAVDTSWSCPESLLDCYTYGFALTAGPSSTTPVSIVASGRVIAPFSDFKQMRPAPVPQTFDTHAVEHFSFGAGPGPYDFCVSNLEFLDAAGQVVLPP